MEYFEVLLLWVLLSEGTVLETAEYLKSSLFTSSLFAHLLTPSLLTSGSRCQSPGAPAVPPTAAGPAAEAAA